MLEKIITFLIFGIFVFSPGIADWQSPEYPMGLLIYAPWLLLIVLGLILHLQEKDPPVDPDSSPGQ